jgi:hypothetical protein
VADKEAQKQQQEEGSETHAPAAKTTTAQNGPDKTPQAAEAAETKTARTLAATIFDVRASSAGCPAHLNAGNRPTDHPHMFFMQSDVLLDRRLHYKPLNPRGSLPHEPLADIELLLSQSEEPPRQMRLPPQQWSRAAQEQG